MSDKLDTLFSPERLRGKWSPQNQILNQKPNIGTSSVPAGYNELYASVEKIIHNRFSGDNRRILEDLMDQLKTRLALRFSTTNKQVLGEDRIAALNSKIDQTLAQIEDLVEAFEIQDKGP